ncbi:hypothetical protein MP228_010492 [Amoeboaphelidium protococcarum]|nr:hypothetical protein MP228_010492 [Amoeboaphelidium protococcarum]
MSNLTKLLQLPTTTLHQYLRPVDLLELCLSCKECRDTILQQRLPLFKVYFWYYGPLIAADRIRLHPYLQLKSKKDYRYFLHSFIKQFPVLLDFARDRYANEKDEPFILHTEWRDAVMEFYPSNTRSSINRDKQQQIRFKKWSDLYSKNKIHCTFDRDLVLASSQLDLIITLFAVVAKQFWNPGTEHDPPVMSVFGYYHDAIKNFWLDALIIVVNKEYDARDYDQWRSQSRAFNRIFGSVHRLDVFVGRICEYFDLGTGDEVREKLLNYLEVSPHFCGIYAYLNILKQLDLIDDYKNPKQFFSELVMKILNHPGQSNLISNGLHRFWQFRDYMQISDKFGQLLTRYLSAEWALQQIEAVEIASSIERGWAVLSLLKLYKNASEINGIYSMIVIEKLNNGLAEEAMNLLIALYSSNAEYAFDCDTALLSDSAVQTLIQALESLLECEIILWNAVDFKIGKLFESVEKFLLDHRQSFISKTISMFSRVRCNEMVYCTGLHDQVKTIVDSLGGFEEFTQYVLSIQPDVFSGLNQCLFMDIVCDHIPLHDQNTLDEVSVHMVELCFQQTRFYPDILAQYFDNMHKCNAYSSVASKKLLQMAEEEKLEQLFTYFSQSEIVALNIGSRFLQPWVNKVIKIEADSRFPDNIIQIVQIFQANDKKLLFAPICVRRILARCISNAVLLQPKHSTSRYWFFEGLPLFIMQDRVILRIYIDIWPHAILTSRSLRVHGYEELVRGLFHYIESNELLPQERISLIQSFCQEAADANNDTLLDVALTLVEQSNIISLDDLEPIR